MLENLGFCEGIKLCVMRLGQIGRSTKCINHFTAVPTFIDEFNVSA